MKLKDLQAKQQKEQEKAKKSVHDPMPSSILHPQQNQQSSKINLSNVTGLNAKSLLMDNQQPPMISMISNRVPEEFCNKTQSNDQNNDKKMKQNKVGLADILKL